MRHHGTRAIKRRGRWRLGYAVEALEQRQLLSTVVYVDASAAGLNNGSSWANAFTNLQSALTTAVSGETIEVAKGTYTPGNSPTSTFQLVNGVSLIGGYASGGSVTAMPEANSTILFGNDTNNHVVTGSGTSSSFVMDGLVISGGTGATVGGGIYIQGGSLNIEDCTVTANSASYDGGGIEIEQGSATLTNCNISDNAMTSDGFGGGMNLYEASATIEDCTFTRNSSSGGFGGGLTIGTGASADVIDSVFADNSAIEGGGVFTHSSGSFVNCTFGQNTASQGGADFNGVSAIVPGESGTVTFANTILWGDLDSDGEIDNDGGTAIVTYSDIQGGYVGTGNINSNPLFVGASSGNLRIEPCSPCVDAGNNAAVPSGITTDLAGNPRFQDVPTSSHNGAGTIPIVDMGAYEATAALSCNAGGPYYAYPSQNIALQGYGSSTVGGSLSYEWTISGGGSVTVLNGPNPVFSTAGYSFGNLTVVLTVSDQTTSKVVDTTTLSIIPPILFVDAGATGLGNGVSWTNAFTTLQQALNAAVPNLGQTIEVAQGEYSPGTTATSTFQLVNGVSVIGGFAKGGSAEPNPAADVTVLSGGNVNFNVVTCNYADTATMLSGFTISGGNAHLGPNYGLSITNENNGGGMYINGGDPTIDDCTFAGNFATYQGGALFAYDSNSAITNCVFIGNSAEFGGGAFVSILSSPTFINCTFTANLGTAIAATGTFTLYNCILWGDDSGEIDMPGYNVTYSDVQGGYTGEANINADPLFVSGIDLQLQSASPCINTGSNAAVPADITTDLGGNPRIVGGTVDMGAYEFQPYLWYGLGDGISWSDAANWSGDQVPNANANVIIPNCAAPHLDSGVSSIQSLALQGNATLDLGNGTLMIDYGSNADPISSIYSYLASGYDGGAWNGPGIISSSVASENQAQSGLIYSVGYADGADGIVSGLSSGQIEIMPTLAGDATLQGNVAFCDFQLLSQYFGQAGTSWDEGNFTYGSTTNFGDFQLLSQNFGQSASTLAADEGSNQPVAQSAVALRSAPVQTNASTLAIVISAAADPVDSILDGTVATDDLLFSDQT
jgi:predicted outer membrane repeat protein